MKSRKYDCAIIGGGVGGLALSILLARSGKRVILFEKETYPFHKVCGEYLSSESLPFLASLSLDLAKIPLPQITQLLMSSPAGISVKRPLDIGGTGVSRYCLDAALADIARALGVKVHDGIRVRYVRSIGGAFEVYAGVGRAERDSGRVPTDVPVTARTVVGAYGKHSIMDVQLGRDYKAQNSRQLFVAVKHHIRAAYDPAVVEMHNFPGGYCGMSAIEDGKVNMSYIVKAAQLRKHGSIAAMEQAVLCTNPHLKRYFNTAEFIFPKPLTISHLYFGMKEPVKDHILMLGDAAGNIAPLSGNGMSMSLQSAAIASVALLAFLNGECGRSDMEARYAQEYAAAFRKRIDIARQIHGFFGKPGLTDWGFRLFRLFPWLVDISGRLIHGRPF